MASQLIQTQSPTPGCSVSVWRESLSSHFDNSCGHQFRKVWKDNSGSPSSSWLSWAHHEHLMLSLLAERGVGHVVKVSSLQVLPQQVDLVTIDAGPEFLRDWLVPSRNNSAATLWQTENDALKFALACLQALQSIHKIGVVHGDIKADNLCINATISQSNSHNFLNLPDLRIIDFAYALYKDAPLQFVLPTDPERLDYMPDFFRDTLQKAQASGNAGILQAAVCANIDLFSLSHLLRQTVSPTLANTWSDWTDFIENCEKIGSQQQRPWINWKTYLFDTPTIQLIKELESLLKRRRVTREKWGLAETSLMHGSTITPLSHKETPSIALTPIIHNSSIVLQESAPLEISLSKYKLSKVKSPRLMSLLGTLLMSLIFVSIDHAYNKHGIVLSDLSYLSGLFSILLGLALTSVASRIFFNPERKYIFAWNILSCMLVLNASYFVFALPLSIEFAILVCLLFFMAAILIQNRRQYQ